MASTGIMDFLLARVVPRPVWVRNINSDLLTAASNGHVNVVKLLLQQGADVKFKDEFGNTALMIAKHKGYQEIAQLLENAGATQ